MVKKQDEELLDVEETLEEPIEDIEVLEDFDLRALIEEGKEADPFRREIEFFSAKHGRIVKIPVYLKPLSHSEWDRLAKATGKKQGGKNIEELVCVKGWVEADGMPYEMSVIKDAPKGLVSSVYEEIKLISGQTHDHLEEKWLEKMSDF